MERLHVLGGVLETATYEDMEKAFAANPCPHVTLENGLIRPTTIPSEAGHVNKRTVMVRPIHPTATEGEISEFFSKYGEVKRTQRHEFTDYRSGEAQTRRKPSVFVIFATVEAADKCIAETPKYAEVKGIGSHFVPTLQVSRRIEQHVLRGGAVAESHIQRMAPGTAPAGVTIRFVGRWEMGEKWYRFLLRTIKLIVFVAFFIYFNYYFAKFMRGVVHVVVCVQISSP